MATTIGSYSGALLSTCLVLTVTAARAQGLPQPADEPEPQHHRMPVLQVGAYQYFPTDGPHGESAAYREALGEPARLDASITSIEIVHTRRSEVGTPTPDGKWRHEMKDYFFVVIQLDQAGYRQLQRLNQAVAQARGPEPRIECAIRAGHFRRAHFSLDDTALTAKVRVVVVEEQLANLARSVHKSSELSLSEWGW